MLTTRRLARALALAAILVAGIAAAGCEATAELIPGSATPTPTVGVDGAPAPQATPIVIPPAGGTGSEATGGRVIPDTELIRSIVQVSAMGITDPQAVVRSGSGVVLDTDRRLIAVAYPVVRPDDAAGQRTYSTIVIATAGDGGVAEPRYRAELVRADVDLGVAILRVTENVDGSAVESFDLPAPAIGDPSVVGTGFALRLFGFPGGAPGQDGGAQAALIAQGTVSGLRGIANRAGRTWFKMDARLPSGAAGGPAFDRFGALVGILAQERYVPGGLVGQVRPIDVVTPLLLEVDRGVSLPPLYRSLTQPGSLAAPPTTTTFVGQPSFAENAVEAGGSRDLFDYETRFAAGLAQLYYEYDLTGVPDGTTIDEQWYLDGVHQDSLSSSYVWDQGGFGIVTDRITSPSPAGFPTGRWRLDVHVGGVLHATATAIVGVPLRQPNATWVGAGTVASPEGLINVNAFSGATHLLGFFEVTGMEGARRVQWVVFRDNQPVYTSPEVMWRNGDSGRYWVGYRPDGLLVPGRWDFELRVDGILVGSGSSNIQ